MKVVSLPVKSLAPHPDNPRGPMAPADVAELAASIRENGLLSPIVVTPGQKPERWTVLAGHRRLMALKALEREEVDCVVLEATETDEMSVMLADNVHRVDLDPVRAGGLVEGFLKAHPTAVIDDVAKKLGKPRRWVAQARALGQLSPAWRKRRENPKDAAATLAMRDLVAIASLHSDAQERLARELTHPHHFEGLDEVLAEETQRLSEAPWDLDDGALVKKAGPCSTCPKTSLGTPGLFDGAGDPGDVKKAICRDGGCFGTKLTAHRVRAVQTAIAEHPGCLVLTRACRDYSGQDAQLRLLSEALKRIDVKVEDSYPYEPSNKTDGKPAYVLAGEKAGKIVYVAKINSSSGKSKAKASGGSGEASDARPAEEQREGKRLRLAFNACQPLVKKLAAPKAEVVLGLVRAYGYGEGRGEDVGHRRKVVAATTSLAAFLEAAWPEIRSTIELRFAVYNGVEAKAREPELRWLAELIGVDLAAKEAEALVEIPEPGARTPKPAPRQPKAKRTAPAKPAKAKKRKAVKP